MEEIKLYYRPVAPDSNPYEATCGEADAAGKTPAEALQALADQLVKVPAGDAVRAAIDSDDGPVPVNVTHGPKKADDGDGEKPKSKSKPKPKPKPKPKKKSSSGKH